MKYVSFKSTYFLQPRFDKPCSCVLLVLGFLFPLLRRDAGTSQERPLPPCVAGQSRTPSAPSRPRPPWPGPWSFVRRPLPPWARRWSRCSWPGAILGAGSSSSAQICARRCWRSPLMTRYQPDPVSPVDSSERQRALGGPPAAGWGLRGGRPGRSWPCGQHRHLERNPLEPWPASPRDPRVLSHGRPLLKLQQPLSFTGPLKEYFKSPEFYFGAELW